VEEILQFIFELLFQAFIELVCDFVFQHLAADLRLVRIGLFSLVGAVAGGISLAVVSHHIIGSYFLRLAGLLITPLLIGFTMRAMGHRRTNRGEDEYGLESFWPGWGFAFCFSLVRFLFAK
jgi:hypothetical protein